MNTETQLRAALMEAGVDFLDGKTLWEDVQSHEAGDASLVVLERLTDDPLDPAFRISRAFLSNGQAHVATEGELSGVGLAEIDDQFGENIQSEMRMPIEAEVGGQLSFVWADTHGDGMSFIGRVGGEDDLDRLVCGHCKRTPSGIIVKIGLDRPIAELLTTR